MKRKSSMKNKIRAVVFDLDDTLYDHKQYVAGAYRDVAAAFHDMTGYPAGKFFRIAWAFFLRRGSRDNRIFCDTLEKFGCRSLRLERAMVKAYRDHLPKLTPLPGVRKGLRDLKRAGFLLGLLSDGRPATQRRKLRALDLFDAFDRVIVTGDFGRECYKPARRCFEMILSRMGCGVSEVLYVGDDPLTDVAGAIALGLPVIRVRQGQYRGEKSPEADFVFDDMRRTFAFILGNSGTAE